MELSPVSRKFVLHWGEMGDKWGVNRTVAQIHALLYLTPEPLDAEAIAATLSVARSNVSTSLRELQGWGVIRVVPRLGDRRDRFTSLEDPWEMFAIVLDERKKREIDPTLALLRECLDQVGDRKADAHVRQRLEAMADFFQTMDAWYRQVRALPRTALIRFVRLGRRIPKWLGLAA